MMNITSVADIENLVRSDPWMMKVLQAAEELGLPDWWIGAGFLRGRPGLRLMGVAVSIGGGVLSVVGGCALCGLCFRSRRIALFVSNAFA